MRKKKKITARTLLRQLGLHSDFTWTPSTQLGVYLDYSDFTRTAWTLLGVHVE